MNRKKLLINILTLLIALAGIFLFSYRFLFPWKPSTQQMKLMYPSRISGDLKCMLKFYVKGNEYSSRPILITENTVRICEDATLQKVLIELPVSGKILKTCVYIRDGNEKYFLPDKLPDGFQYSDYAHIFVIYQKEEGTKHFMDYIVPSSYKDDNDLKAIKAIYKSFDIQTNADTIISVFNDIPKGTPKIACQTKDLRTIYLYGLDGNHVKTVQLEKQIYFRPLVDGQFFQDDYCIGYDGENVMSFYRFEADPTFKPRITIPLKQKGNILEASFDVALQYFDMNPDVTLNDGISLFVISYSCFEEQDYFNKDRCNQYKFDLKKVRKTVDGYYFPSDDGLYIFREQRVNDVRKLIKISEDVLEPLAGENSYGISSDIIRAYFGKWDGKKCYLKVALNFWNIEYETYMVNFEPIGEKITGVVYSNNEKGVISRYVITDTKVYDLADTIIRANTLEQLKNLDNESAQK